MIGSHEVGLDIDKIAFSKTGLFYRICNLEKDGAASAEIPETENVLIVDLSIF